LTGHTGFKGSWIALWLTHMGANVHGYSLRPIVKPNLFELANIAAIIKSSIFADITNQSALNEAMNSAHPSVVIHMAAQALVLQSYKDPVETMATNVMGTVNVLEAARSTESVKAIINVTTDKCYENFRWPWPYRETDQLGGKDPYSASKACSELISHAYSHSFFKDSGMNLATARAGNVIGGGDWAEDRLIPDMIRAVENRTTIKLRSPHSIRPWQHVLEPLSGYLTLAENLVLDSAEYNGSWNFGPDVAEGKTVQWVAEKLANSLPDCRWEEDRGKYFPEASTLKLDSSKAREMLGWHSKWTTEQAVEKTASWYNSWMQGLNAQDLCLGQIMEYQDS